MGLIAILITVIFGTLLTYLFGLNFRKTERISVGALLGFGIQTYIMFLFYMGGMRFTLVNTLVETVIVAAFVLAIIAFYKSAKVNLLNDLNFVNLYRVFKSQKGKFLRSNLLFKTIWIAIFGLIATSFVIGIFFPVYGWDSLVLYNFRAQVFVATGGMEDGISRGYFFGYPLMTSLAHTWFYFFKSNPHLFYWSIYGSFIGVVYFCLKPFLRQPTLLLTTFVIALLPSTYSGSYFDYTNFPYNVYLLAGILYISRFVRQKKWQYLLLGGIFTGISTWVRQTEPFWVINLFTIFVLALFELKNNFWKPIGWFIGSSIPFFLIQQPWRLYEAKNIGAGTNISDQAGYAIKSIKLFNLNQLMDVIGTTTQKTIPTWQPYLLVAIFISLFARDNIKKAWIFLYFVLLNILLLYFATYTFSIIWKENWKEILDSQQRLSSFIPPILIIYTSVLIDDYVTGGLEIFDWAIQKLKKKILE